MGVLWKLGEHRVVLGYTQGNSCALPTSCIHPYLDRSTQTNIIYHVFSADNDLRKNILQEVDNNCKMLNNHYSFTNFTKEPIQYLWRVAWYFLQYPCCNQHFLLLSTCVRHILLLNEVWISIFTHMTVHSQWNVGPNKCALQHIFLCERDFRCQDNVYTVAICSVFYYLCVKSEFLSCCCWFKVSYVSVNIFWHSMKHVPCSYQGMKTWRACEVYSIWNVRDKLAAGFDYMYWSRLLSHTDYFHFLMCVLSEFITHIVFDRLCATMWTVYLHFS